jgi:hypothetical protein
MPQIGLHLLTVGWGCQKLTFLATPYAERDPFGTPACQKGMVFGKSHSECMLIGRGSFFLLLASCTSTGQPVAHDSRD